jgi:serine/threonine-protein kinase
MSDPNIGRLLSKRYQLVELLGQGSMGRVYAAEDKLLGGVPVALKFLSQAMLNQKMRERFEREATTSALLGQRSIHIIRVSDYGIDDDGIPYYVMEYLKGNSLSEIIMQQAIRLPRFLNLSRQICQGLQAAHKGIPIDGEICPIVHRDIKPSNIYVLQDDSYGELAKVLDFGIAKALQPDSNQTNCFMGTLAYASPEQMEGRELDSRSDIYSMGVMMYQMLTGRMPVNAETHTFGSWYRAHHELSPRPLQEANTNLKVPKALENLIMSCLAKEPDNRPQTATEIVNALAPLEQRFGSGREIGRRIEEVLSKVPVTDKPSTKQPLPTPDDIYRLVSWPSDKPLGDISFPKPIPTSNGVLPALWVMFSQEEINRCRICTRYNHFLFAQGPHPSMLWLTVLYNRENGPRWLPSYIDLKTRYGQQLVRLLSETGKYRILFFAKEQPRKCANSLTSTIAPTQCKMFRNWVTMAQSGPNPHAYGTTKNQLKQALEELKPKVLLKLESMYNTDSGDLSG